MFIPDQSAHHRDRWSVSADEDGGAEFHTAVDLTDADFTSVQTKMCDRGLRWLHRHGHLDSAAVHTLDAPDHAGGWSVDASVTIPEWDRSGLERLSKLVPPRVNKHRYCGVLAPNAGLRGAANRSAGPPTCPIASSGRVGFCLVGAYGSVA